MFVLVASFTEPAPPDALALLAEQPTCRRLTFAQSTDVRGQYVLLAEFGDAPGYRRALSPFEVRTLVIPWLSTAQPGSGVFEALDTWRDGAHTRHDPIVTPGR